MKKINLLFAVLFSILLAIPAQAQWGGTNPITANADVGIADYSFTPLQRLHLRNGNFLVDYYWTDTEIIPSVTHNAPVFFVGAKRFDPGYNMVGVRTSVPTQAFHVNGDIRIGTFTSGSYRGTGKLAFGASGSNPTDYLLFTDQNNSSLPFFSIFKSNVNRFSIAPDGTTKINGSLKVVNGSTVNFKVSNLGEIHGRSLDIDLLTIPDYVFKTGYKLMPLLLLEKFINENHHLPNIKSESEYKAEGKIDIGELNMKLLEKVEELTLYIIELHKRVEVLEKQTEQ